MRESALEARERQAARFNGSMTRYNSQMTSREIRSHCPLDDSCELLLRSSLEQLGLSARAHDKVLRVARTIADLEAAGDIRAEHIQEAVNYRMLDRHLWN